jgi:hypothetical protein
MIELIRLDDLDAALHFATVELAPRGAQHPEFLADLERTMALLAFPDLAKYADDENPILPTDQETLTLFQDPAFAPIKKLMQRSQRHLIAKELNSAILGSQGSALDTKLSGLLRLMSWSEERMAKAGAKVPESDRQMDRKWADQLLG